MPAGFKIRSAPKPDTYLGRLTNRAGLAFGPPATIPMGGISNTNVPRMSGRPGLAINDDPVQIARGRKTRDEFRKEGVSSARRFQENAAGQAENRSAAPLRVGPPDRRFVTMVENRVPAEERGGGMPVGPAAGPMTRIYGGRKLTGREETDLQAVGGGRGLVDFYNRSAARSGDRAAALNVIWDKGGVPVIGGGKARVPVQDFGGVDTSPRVIDTGIRPGAYTDEDHAAALAAHRSGDIVGGGPLAPFARLAPTRTRGSGGGGLFTSDRVRRQPSKADRALASAVALENAKNGGAVEAARLNAGVELQKAGLEAETARRGQDVTAATEAAKLKPNATALSPRRVKQDGRYYEATQDDRGQIVYKPLSDAEQQRWGKIDAAVASMNDPATRQAALAYARNPEQSVPVYDWKTGRIAFQPTNPKWDVGTPEWQKEYVAKGQPRYATLASVDPELEAELQWWFQSALQGTPA